ncbi:MAG: hypothetical protein IKD03_04050 [Clostridia bacterium]|nr:hypothetical protein [Clostridia bacterium]
MTKKRTLFSAILLVCAIVMIASALVIGGTVYANVYGSQRSNFIEQYYEYGQTFEVPEYSIDGEKATAIVTLPDKSQTLDKSVPLNQAGLYKIEYSVLTQSGMKTQEFSFKVKDPVATGATKSSVYYGTSPYGDASDTPGLVVALDQADTLNFTQVIDLRGSTKETFFVELFPTPTSHGSADCEQFWITLTDVENEESYLMIRMNMYDDGKYKNMTLAARSDCQPQVIGYESSRDKIHVGNQYGAYPGVQICGSVHGIYERDGAINTLKLSYEESTKIVWSHNKWGMPTKIVDLDDPAFVGESLWRGFASGKVKMSFYANGYMAPKANYVFKSVLGTDLTKGGIDDTTAPVIEITEPEYQPAVGGEYPVPAYTVTDESSAIVEQSVTVLKGGFEVPVADGRFKVDSTGEYNIVYTATDAFGNKATRMQMLRTATAPLPLNQEVTLNATYNRGEKVVLPSFIPSGGVGKTTLSVYATVGDEKQEIKNGEFTPMQAGEYVITYEVVDEIGQKNSKDYAVTVVNGAQPVFRDEPRLPDYLISTFSYRDPVLYAYDYSTGEEKKIAASLTVTSTYGSQTVESGEGFIPLVKTNLEEVTLTWKAGDSTLTRKVKTIFAFNSDEILTENYFVGDTSVKRYDGYMEFTATGDSSSWTFVNPLIADGFTLDLSVLPYKSSYEGLEITLTDAVDESVQIKAYVAPEGDKYSTLTVGRRTALLSNGFDEYSVSNRYVFGYDRKEFSVGTAKLKVDKTASGEEFNGFPSETVKLTVSFIGAREGAKYQVMNVCGQPVGILLTDRVRPSVKILGNYGGTSEVGAIATIPAMIACDVLNPTVMTSVTVKDGAGEYVVAEDGTVLNYAPTTREYKIATNEIGKYQVEYVAKDTLSGRETRTPFVITVFDAQAPTASFRTAPVSAVKVGENIVIPDVIVSDNVTSAENIMINYYIVSATGRVIRLTEGYNGMKTKYAGTYQIRVLVYDEAGNITLLSHDVTVTE